MKSQLTKEKIAKLFEKTSLTATEVAKLSDKIENLLEWQLQNDLMTRNWLKSFQERHK